MASFNLIVTWTWPILGLAMALYSLGSTAHSEAGQIVLLSGSYTLSSGTFASNLCAGALYAMWEPDSFTVCDVVGVGAGAVVEGAWVHYTFTTSEWEYVRGIPGNTKSSIVQAFEGSVNRARETLMCVVRNAQRMREMIGDLQ